jgi:hypothetical protein
VIKSKLIQPLDDEIIKLIQAEQIHFNEMYEVAKDRWTIFFYNNHYLGTRLVSQLFSKGFFLFFPKQTFL